MPFRRQGWAISHFQNVRSLFLKCKKVRFRTSHFFSHICSFWKSDCAIALFFALLKRVTKSANAQLHFEKMWCANVRLPNPSVNRLPSWIFYHLQPHLILCYGINCSSVHTIHYNSLIISLMYTVRHYHVFNYCTGSDRIF